MSGAKRTRGFRGVEGREEGLSVSILVSLQ